MNQSFLFFELIGVFIVHWLILEPQTYVVVEQFGTENIPLLSGRLVFHSTKLIKMIPTNLSNQADEYILLIVIFITTCTFSPVLGSNLGRTWN